MKKIIVIVSIAVLIIISCASLPTNFDTQTSYNYTNVDSTAFAKAINNKRPEDTLLSGFYPLDNGLDAFAARAEMIQHAEKSVDVQYYLFHNDLIGNLLINELIKAAEKGVRVRILLDDLALKGRDELFRALVSIPNVYVKFFNPFNRKSSRVSQLCTSKNDVTRRMHNKSFTVDNSITIIGGRNIGNEYFEADPHLDFNDLDVICVGPVVQGVSSSFDEYWNSPLSYPAESIISKEINSKDSAKFYTKFYKYISSQEKSEYKVALQHSDFYQRIENDSLDFFLGHGTVVSDKPEKLQVSKSNTKYNLVPQLEKFFATLEDELIIFSPYFIPGKDGTAYLIDLEKKGVNVKILTNSLASNDVSVVHSGYAKYRKELLEGGVDIYELNKKLTKTERKTKKETSGGSKASLHAKSFVLDKHLVFIGSLNLDPRSVVHNTEIGVVIDSKELANLMSDGFIAKIDSVSFKLELDESGDIIWRGIENGKEVTYDKEPHTSFWRRFSVGFMKLLPIESQL